MSALLGQAGVFGSVLEAHHVNESPPPDEPHEGGLDLEIRAAAANRSTTKKSGGGNQLDRSGACTCGRARLFVWPVASEVEVPDLDRSIDRSRRGLGKKERASLLPFEEPIFRSNTQTRRSSRRAQPRRCACLLSSADQQVSSPRAQSPPVASRGAAYGAAYWSAYATRVGRVSR